jgi:hypothetical protein
MSSSDKLLGLLASARRTPRVIVRDIGVSEPHTNDLPPSELDGEEEAWRTLQDGDAWELRTETVGQREDQVSFFLSQCDPSLHRIAHLTSSALPVAS